MSYKKPEVPSDKMLELKELVTQMEESEAYIRNLQAELDAAEDDYKQIVEERIPEIMDEVGMAKLVTDSGREIMVEEKIRASLSGEFRESALKWLEDNGFASIVKHEVVVRFGKGEQGEADALCRYVTEADYEVRQNKKVEPSTLSAFVREQLRDGEELPSQFFNIFRQRKAKVK